MVDLSAGLKLRMLVDGDIPRRLSASYREDFAYPTVKDRLPVILTKVVDYVYRLRTEVSETHGESGTEDLKMINGQLSRLKNELQTDKPITDLQDDGEDVAVWNEFLRREKKVGAEKSPSWFTSPWLYTECYFYRRIHSAIQLSTQLKTLDPFGTQKQQALTSAWTPMSILASHLLKICDTIDEDTNAVKAEFTKFLKISLWGNKCDLSISGGAQNTQKDDSLAQVEALESFLLVDDADKVWRKLTDRESSNGDRNVRFDIVLDNAGFELFSDLCLAEFLISSGLVREVVLHPKSLPWFVSDTTQTDLDWTVEQLSSSADEHLSKLGHMWRKRFEDKTFKVFHHRFWTLPFDFVQMQEEAADLYSELGNSNLVLFKGDLNYRKLAGDRKWNPTTPFQVALGKFQPAPLCALRTLKCDMVVGLRPGQAEEAQKKNNNWMIAGDFGVIQFRDGLL